jgi:hypothetical protein
MTDTRNISGIKVGDIVSIRYKRGIRGPDEIKLAPVTKVTPSAVYADNSRFSKTTLRGLDGRDNYVLMGIATADEIGEHKRRDAAARKSQAARDEARTKYEAKRAELQALVEPLGGFVKSAEFGDGWAIDGLSEDAIRKIGKLIAQ